MMKQIATVALMALVMLTGCEKEEESIVNESFLKTDSPSSIAFSSIGGENEVKTVKVTTNTDTWTVTSDTEWCHITQAEKEFTILVDENRVASERSAIITVSTKTVEPIQLTIKQAAAVISAYSFELPNFTESNVYKVIAGTTPIAEVTREYLFLEGKLNVQVVVIYPTDKDGIADLEKGFVAKITQKSDMDNTAIIGGKVAFDKTKNTIAEFSSGNQQPQNNITIQLDEKSIQFTTAPGEAPAQLQPDKVTDADGNKYPIVKIGTQYWMGENLRTTKYNDGEAIVHAPEAAQWIKAANDNTGAYSIPLNDPNNKKTYGILYNAYALGYSRKMEDLPTDRLSPQGWKIPSGWKLRMGDIHVGTPIVLKSDMDRLMRYLQGSNENGASPKMRDPKSWKAKIVNGVSRGEPWGDNLSLFTATGSGFRSYLLWPEYADGDFSEFQHIEGWWCSTIPLSQDEGRVHYEVDASSIWGTNTDLDYTHQDKGLGLSVRCLRK